MVPKGLLKKIGPFLEVFKPCSDCEPVSCKIVNMASCCRGRQPVIRRGWSIMIHCAQGLKEGSERVGGSRSDKPGCLLPHCSSGRDFLSLQSSAEETSFSSLVIF